MTDLSLKIDQINKDSKLSAEKKHQLTSKLYMKLTHLRELGIEDVFWILLLKSKNSVYIVQIALVIWVISKNRQTRTFLRAETLTLREFSDVLFQYSTN